MPTIKIPKGAKQNPQVFGTYYVQLCQKQNLAPVATIKKQLANKILDFVGDGVKLHEWQLLLKALRTDRTLKGIAIRSRKLRQKVLEDIDTEGKAHSLQGVPALFTKFIVQRIVDTCCRCIRRSEELTSVVFERIPLDKDAILQIAQAIEQSKSVKELGLPYCQITDEGCHMLCKVLCTKDTLTSLDLSGCDITKVGAAYLCETLEKQKIHRLEDFWKDSLCYNNCDLDTMAGLRRLTLNCNPLIGDAGITSLCTVIMDDYWLKALDIQVCGLTEPVLNEVVLKLIMQNETLQIIDIRGNNLHPTLISSVIAMQEEKISSCKIKYQWLKEVPSNNRLFFPASGFNRNPTSRLASSNTYSIQKPKMADDSRQIQSDTTLNTNTLLKLSSQARHIKSCDTVPQGNINNTSPTNKFSHRSQLRCSITIKKSCPSENMPQGNNTNTSPTNKFSHHSQLSCSTANKKLCPPGNMTQVNNSNTSPTSKINHCSQLSCSTTNKKLCPTGNVPQGNNINISPTSKINHLSQLSHSTTNKRLCPSGNMPQGNINNTSLKNKISHCSQLSCSKTNAKLCPSDQGAIKGTYNGSKIKTRIAVRLGEFGPAPRRTPLAPPPSAVLQQSMQSRNS